MSGRSWATLAGDQMSLLLISASRPPFASPASVAATMPGDVSELSAKEYGPALKRARLKSHVVNKLEHPTLSLSYRRTRNDTDWHFA